MLTYQLRYSSYYFEDVESFSIGARSDAEAVTIFERFCFRGGFTWGSIGRFEKGVCVEVLQVWGSVPEAHRVAAEFAGGCSRFKFEKKGGVYA